MGKVNIPQWMQVKEALERRGGVATLADLYRTVDVSSWGTNTPYHSIRRIVQTHDIFFRIRPGLWGLSAHRLEVLEKLNLGSQNAESIAQFDHSYYQGLAVQLGNLMDFQTYVPPQDKNQKFLGQPLKDIVTMDKLPAFSHAQLVDRAKSIDVIWFNERQMPNTLLEIEFSTDFQNSLGKFCELQDLNTKFLLVADQQRRKSYESKIAFTAFKEIGKRTKFLSFDDLVELHQAKSKEKAIAQRTGIGF